MVSSFLRPCPHIQELIYSHMLCGYPLHKDTGSLVLVSRYNVYRLLESVVCMQNGLSLLGAAASVNLAI